MLLMMVLMVLPVMVLPVMTMIVVCPILGVGVEGESVDKGPAGSRELDLRGEHGLNHQGEGAGVHYHQISHCYVYQS